MKPAEHIKKLITNAKIDTNAKVDEAVLNDVLKALEDSKKTKAAVSQASILSTIIKSRISKLTVATAMIIIASLLGVKMLSGPDEQPSRKVVKKFEVPDRGLVVKSEAGKLYVELEHIEQMFKAGDIDGLAAMLSEGEYKSKVAAANYLAKMGAVQGLEPLEKLIAEYHKDEPDNPFVRAVAEIKSRAAANAGASSPGTVMPRVDSSVAAERAPSILAMGTKTRDRAIYDSAMRHEPLLDEFGASFQAQAKEIADGYPIKGGGTSIAEVVPASLHQNLVLYYSFHTNTNAETAVDISGKGLHGQVHGAKYTDDEVLGGAMSFDGDDDYIKIPDVYLEAFTIAAWVKTSPEGSINNRRIFMLYDEEHCYAVEGNANGGISVGAEKMETDDTTSTREEDETATEENNAIVFTGAERGTRLSSNRGWARSDWANGAQFSEYHWRLKPDTWTHITITYDGTTGKIYRNGKPTETSQIPAEGFIGTAYIGGIESHNGGFWHGLIDEVALFDRALSEEEVKELYLMNGEVVEVPEAVEEPDIVTVENELVEVDSVPSTKHTVATGFTGHAVYPADVDGDGDLDVVGASEYRDIRFSTRSLRSATELSSSTFSGTTRTRSGIMDTGEDNEERGSVTVRWWENTDGNGTAWTEHTVDANFGGTKNAYPADIDLDGDVDIFGSDHDTYDIVWWENVHSNGTFWIKHPVDVYSDNVQLVKGSDIDSDGDMDVVGATFLGGGINWWENADGKGGAWKKHTIDGTTDADYCRTHSMWVMNIDGDRDPDVIASAGRESGINWWENPNEKGADWTRHYVVDSDGEVESVYPADLDGDGDTDIVGSIRRHDGLTWWENTNRTGTEWTKHVIDSSYDAEQNVDVADMDNDGDSDILGVARRINTMMWWENKNGNGTEWAKHTITRNFQGGCVYAADMDGDGDHDMLGVAEVGGEIAWFENQPNAD